MRSAPTGAYARRLWFLYEWLLGDHLDLPDADRGKYATVVSPELRWDVAGAPSSRHRAKNNLPGTPGFCPMVFRTPVLASFMARNVVEEARRIADQVPADLLVRTAAFLLLNDSLSSFQIEGEEPPRDRIQRWGRGIAEAGRRPVERKELERLGSP